MTVPDRPLYDDGQETDGYRTAAGRPKSSKTQEYHPPRLRSGQRRHAQVLLFEIEDPKTGDVYQGTIADPVPGRHYAQMLIDATEYGVTMAEARMINNILGAESMRRLAACDSMTPDELVSIMTQVAARAHGPYAEMMGKAREG